MPMELNGDTLPYFRVVLVINIEEQVFEIFFSWFYFLLLLFSWVFFLNYRELSIIYRHKTFAFKRFFV